MLKNKAKNKLKKGFHGTLAYDRNLTVLLKSLRILKAKDYGTIRIKNVKMSRRST